MKFIRLKELFNNELSYIWLLVLLVCIYVVSMKYFLPQNWPDMPISILLID